MDIQEKLAQELYRAAAIILTDLFRNGEHFYYITLTTDGGANTPCISAWSYEALRRSSTDEEERKMLKWSYADSPYCCWKQEAFEAVEALLLSRGNVWEMDAGAFERECRLRLASMEEAMKCLDRDGIFGINQERDAVMVLAEVMPPDGTNTERAYRMNRADSKIFAEWLEEAAEE